MTTKTESTQCGWFVDGKIYKRHQWTEWELIQVTYPRGREVTEQIRICGCCGKRQTTNV